MTMQHLVSLFRNHRFHCCDFPPWVSEYDKLLGRPQEIAKQSRAGARPGTVLHSDNTVRMNGTAVE